MKILLTNDDGIDAPGLQALQAACSSLGKTVVVAPRECHSAMGHRVTTDAPIHVKHVGAGRYSVEGTPADCTRIGVTCLIPDVEWVFSGINRGGNLGADTYTSGTVAAAREAALLGFRSAAISHYVGRRRDVNWNSAAARAAKAIDYVISNPPAAGHFWNVNLPHPPDDEADCELVLCPLDPSPLGVLFEREGDSYRYCGDYHRRPRLAGADVDQCFSGKIAATLI